MYANYLVNRVHWLRARAQRMRWNEELVLVRYEMGWTVNFYLYQTGIWTERTSIAKTNGDRGATAYASRKEAMWLEIANRARVQFKDVVCG